MRALRTLELRTVQLAALHRTDAQAGRIQALAEQDVVLTVPASFDEEARELTVAAAREAAAVQLGGFEPEQEECERLNAQAKTDSAGFRSLRYVPTAVGRAADLAEHRQVGRDNRASRGERLRQRLAGGRDGV